MVSVLDVVLTLGVVGIIAIVAKIASLMKWRWQMQAALKDFPDHPRGIFFLGHGKAFTEGARGMLANFDAIYENNVKAVQMWATPFEPGVLVYHPQTMKGVFSTADGKTFAYCPMKPWIGDGLLVSKGKKWARNRRLLTPAFHFDILKPYVKIFVDSAKNLSKRWKNVCHDNACSVEVMQDISLATLESLLRCVMGVEESSGQLEARHPYVKANYIITEQLFVRFINLHYQSDLIYALSPDGYRNRQALKVTHDFTRTVVKERKQRLRLSKCDASNRERLMPFIDILLQAKDEDGVGLNDQEIYDEVDTFMFEGHDTMASALSWIVYNLAQHPELQERCRKEVDEVIGGKGEDILDWDNLCKLEYLAQFIKESMRLYPPVPAIGRNLTSSITLPDGRVIPKGVNVYLDINNLHRNPNVWKDPEVFDPDRFAKENVATRSSHDFVPFSAGPRNCIGQHFAMSEMKTFIAVLLRHFRFDPDNSKPVQRTVNAVLRSTTGIHVFVKPKLV